MSNPVIFVSLGPGEPDLITLTVLKALQNEDCIFCPETRTANGRIFSRAADILHALDIPNTTLSRFALPMSKKREQAFAAYDKVYNEASLLHKENKKVCIVAEGDAGFYSSVHYIFEKLQADNIPEEIEKYMEEKTTIVIMKLSQCTEEIHRCIHLHPEYNYHYFENIGTEKEKYLHDTELISALSFPYFSLLIIRHSTF